MAETYTTIDGTMSSHFSKEVFNRQSSFCCNDTDTRKVIRWVGCKPSVFKSAQTLFTSTDFALCSWFQTVDIYNFTTIRLESDEIAYIDLNSKYILAKAAWPSSALEEQKLIEIGTGEQPGYVGMTIPFTIGMPTSTTYRYQVIKDLFHLNTNSDLTTAMKITNISPYPVSVSILYAK
jgi:hypothetical protein